jgi:signal transduction histidine kinase
MLLPLPAVLGDRTALHLVFANLIGNALKFSKREVPPVVTVSAADNGGAVRIVVQDNGIGIDPGHFRKVFNMFERIHAEERGTGVGLAIVQKAVERMGGRVGVESEPGIGSRFWVELNKAPHR